MVAGAECNTIIELMQKRRPGIKNRIFRAAPIDAMLEARIQDHFKRNGLFSNCLNSFDKTLGASKIPVPAGQSFHVLRHTLSSRFVMNGGNILTLRKILGHTSLAMTMRYAHLTPDHLQDALRFGPIADFEEFFRQWPSA
jgi:site-specific recombinase XerD